MKPTLRAAAFGAAASLALAVPAAAQTMDYGSLEQLFGEPVTTSATGKPQRASDAPVTMEIITAEEIRQSGAHSIPDILQRVVGLDVARFGYAQADVSVRGYRAPFSPRLLVLVDGRQIYLDHFGMTNWNALPIQLAEIRQIEVVKGPNTALFGFNAVGGVVNIVTYNPLYDSVNNVTTRVGTQKHRELSGVATVKLGEAGGLRISAGGYNADEFDTAVAPGDAAARSRQPSRRAINASGLFQLAPGVQVGIEGSNVESKLSEFVNSYSYFDGDYHLWSGKVSLSANTGIGLIEAMAYQNVADIDTNFDIRFDNTVRVAKIQDLFKIGTDHSFRISAEYRRNEFERISGTSAKVAYDVYSGGGMWDWSINESLNLVNALRVDHLRLERSGPFVGTASPFTNADYDRKLTEWSVNSGLVYKVTDLDTVRLSFSRGIQVPSLFEYGQMMAFGAFGFYGNPNLDPTVVTNYEIGYDRAIASIGGGLRTALYYQTNTAMKSVSRYISPTTAIYDNVGDSKAVGIDTSLRGTVGDNWRWKVGYAFEAVNDDFEGYAASALEFENATPRHKINAELTYIRGPWDFNLFGQYVSETEMLRSNGMTASLRDVPASFTLAGKIGYQVTENINLALTGMNITQDQQRLTSGYPEERRVFLTLSANF
ncbi:TonB-dependent receptor plug domain-containing protein [Azospirillum halopraeferens]|uniref:TonB-dependent receptor plug domain-containing protein n=1 Tax=Azospirillum halopraeferens TaxID=34010 RepID=UPI0004172816|nr:TonB-dependent receptor [Azospirillum halopraeferens]